MQDIKNAVCYKDFGARGDGVTEDFEALYRAHAYANEKGLPVFAESGKRYYIKDTRIDGIAREIIIKTDTDWQGATVIIDDTELSLDEADVRTKHIFSIEPDFAPISLSGEDISNIGKIDREKTKKIDLGLGYPAMIMPTDENKLIYIRYGGNANNGAPKSEPVLIDKNGNIDESTPLMYDYDALTKIKVIRADERPISLKNGKIITYASRVSTTLSDGTKRPGYFDRGIRIRRSRTTVCEIKHEVRGEFTPEEQKKGYTGPSYHGIFTVNDANDVLISNCSFPARRYYRIAGTYGFNAYNSNAITLKDCIQPNFYKSDGKTLSTDGGEYWGIGGVNFCKNLVYDGCTLSRYDAHQGLGGGKIINSKVSMIQLIGGGEMLIENSEIEHPDRIIHLRPDYGATWDGHITIRNCRATTDKSYYQLVTMLWTNHDFGYRCYFPDITVENLSFTNGNIPVKVYAPMSRDLPKTGNMYTEPHLHKELTSRGEENKNPYVPPKFIEVTANEYGVEFYIEDIPFLENVRHEGLTKISFEDVEKIFI